LDDQNNSGGGLIARMNGWWLHPFNSSGSALNWVLFVGLLVIAAFLWQTVLILLTKEV
jgi:hypothetical protein